MSNISFSADWEDRPLSPSLIRLISFGKLLDDKVPVSGMTCSHSLLALVRHWNTDGHGTECKFNREAPNVVHMTVKPQESLDEEDAKGAKSHYGGHREVGERSPGCRCVIL